MLVDGVFDGDVDKNNGDVGFGNVGHRIKAVAMNEIEVVAV